MGGGDHRSVHARAAPIGDAEPHDGDRRGSPPSSRALARATDSAQALTRQDSKAGFPRVSPHGLRLGRTSDAVPVAWTSTINVSGPAHRGPVDCGQLNFKPCFCVAPKTFRMA